MIESGQETLYKFVSGILENKKCHLYRINGVEDHFHIITHIHPSVGVADLIKDIKLGSTSLIKTTSMFPDFKGWMIGYGAFTYSMEAKENLISYVMNQKEHHRKTNFRDEYRKLIEDCQIEIDERYFLL